MRRAQPPRPAGSVPLGPRRLGLGPVHGGPAPSCQRRGRHRLSDDQLAGITAWYNGAVAEGITSNQDRRTQTAKDGLWLSRRFRDHQDMILLFTTDLAFGFTSNQAERDIRPRQSQAAHLWRTLDGLADFAIVQSCLSTTAKWDISKPDALSQLFTTGRWLPATAKPG